MADGFLASTPLNVEGKDRYTFVSEQIDEITKELKRLNVKKSYIENQIYYLRSKKDYYSDLISIMDLNNNSELGIEFNDIY